MYIYIEVSLSQGFIVEDLTQRVGGKILIRSVVRIIKL